MHNSTGTLWCISFFMGVWFLIFEQVDLVCISKFIKYFITQVRKLSKERGIFWLTSLNRIIPHFYHFFTPEYSI